MDGTQTHKRPRPVLSCRRCRDKKLKCDRVTPCQNCIKAGCSEDCMYGQNGETSDSLPDPKRVQLSTAAASQHPDQCNASESVTGVGIIEDLQQRMVKLEEMLSIRPITVTLDRRREASVVDSGNLQGSNITPSTSSPPFLGTLVVKGSRTRYHGQNDRITLLNQFAEAKEFINQCMGDSSIVGLAKEVQFLQSKSQLPLNSPESVSDLGISPELLELRALLPSKPVCDQLLETYTKNFEKTLRILHVPTFIHQYMQFWADPDHETHQSPAFLPQLTAVLTIALAFEGQSTTLDNFSTEYLKRTAISLIQVWLQKLGRKHRAELATLQVEALLVQARHLRLQSAEDLWSATGALVRSAMVMGLHLNLSKSTNVSVFQVENRRRLWITIVEMELQASIASGMPVMTPDLDFGPLTPANLNDYDFDESTVELPPPKPLHTWTDSLAQATLAMSLSQRINAMALVRIASPEIDLSELVKHGRVLEECLRQIPSPLKLDHTVESDENPALLLNRVLLDVYTRRPLLCLYRPIVVGDISDDPAFLEIQQVCLESSLAILSYQDYFDPNVADLDVFNSNAYWDVFQIFCKNDILGAALSVCRYIKLSSQQQPTAQTPPNHPQTSLPATQRGLTQSKASLTRTVENTLDSLTRRIGETGSNMKDILLLAVVLQSVRGRGSAQQKERLMHQGAKKALSACRQHLLPVIAEQSLADFAQMLQSTEPMFTSTTQAQSTHNPPLELPDFLAQSSALATEFNNFEGDPFLFDDGSFVWNP